MLNEGHVAAAFHEASEGPRVSEVVLHVVADAVAAGGAVAEVAQVAVLPVVRLVPRDGRLTHHLSHFPFVLPNPLTDFEWPVI